MYEIFRKIPIPAEMSSKSFGTSDRMSKKEMF
jgi:hypothetical protein